MNEKDEIEILVKIKHLEVELEKLKGSLFQPKEGRWKPYELGVPIIGSVFPNPHNCFRTKALAELRSKQREAEDELFNIWEHLVGNWRPDWNNEDEEKWYIEFWEGMADYGSTYDVIDKPLYRYFPTPELAITQCEQASDHARAYMEGKF